MLNRRRGLSSPDLSELREFAKSEREALRKKSYGRSDVKASLAALGSILGRVAQRV